MNDAAATIRELVRTRDEAVAERIRILYGGSVKPDNAAELLAPADVDGALVVPERLTQQDIADRVGASRDMVSRLMKDLVAGGYLAEQERGIVLSGGLPPRW